MFLTKNNKTMSSSAICPKFSQNAWRKDLCSNCFKSKEDHKISNSKNVKTETSKIMSKVNSISTPSPSPSISTSVITTTESSTTSTVSATIQNNNAIKQPIKSIMKYGIPNKEIKNKLTSSSYLLTTSSLSTASSINKKSNKVCFPKEFVEIIGYGGDWSDCDNTDDEDNDYSNTNSNNQNEEIVHLDEEDLELERLTKSNTDFNMNNGNLLGNATDNIKKSFAPLRLGAPQLDAEGKKQTLKISVQPFGAPVKMSSMKEKFELSKMEYERISKEKKMTNTTTSMSTTTTSAITSSSSSSVTLVANKSESNNKKENKELNNNKKITTSATNATSLTSNIQQSSIINNVKDSLETAVVAQVDSDGTNSPPVERAMEKSLLEEISETLEQKKLQQEQTIETSSTSASKIQSGKDGRIKFEVNNATETTSTSSKTFELKKSIARNPPITKDHVKPKITVFSKYTSNGIDSSDSNNASDNENGISAYYDVVETTASSGNNAYENLPDGKSKDQVDNNNIKSNSKKNVLSKEKENNPFSSSQYITDMLLSSRTTSASYSLHEGSFMTSKITSDGLIVTKCSSDDALDSTGSSFDGSSDEEASYNMNRSESDSGIGISITNDYKTTKVDKFEKKLSVSTNNSDYEDIQVIEEEPTSKTVNCPAKTTKIPDKTFSVEKSRELAGEPDGSADPDGTKGDIAENLPALPKSPPPTSPVSPVGKIKTAMPDPRSSFLHGMQKNISSINAMKKPDVPAKPASVNVLKTFAKRQPTQAEQQVVSQLQQVIKSPISKTLDNPEIRDTLSRREGSEVSKMLKKGRAPNPPPVNLQMQDLPTPPPTPPQLHDKNYSLNMDPPKIQAEIKKIVNSFGESSPKTSMKTVDSSSPVLSTNSKSESITSSDSNPHSCIYMRNPQLQTGNNFKSTSPVIREKDKRERAIVNPKFRSLNTFSHRKNQQQLIIATSELKPSTPEPTPRKNLSMSEECLSSEIDKAKQKPKTKFSIKKFLRMGTSKTTDNLQKKDEIYSEICTGEDNNTVGKPRLVIIHPIDINTTGVEVVKDIPKSPTTPDIITTAVAAGIISGKPPAPPQRTLNIDGNKLTTEVNKPARPPPPKSAELRRKQKIGFNINLQQGGSVKTKADNVYANLGEIRSAIAPRKPERTASMREREAQLELARKRGNSNENSDTISVCSSNGGSVSNSEHHNCPISSPTASATSTLESVFKNKSGHTKQKQQQEIRDSNFSEPTYTSSSANALIKEKVVEDINCSILQSIPIVTTPVNTNPNVLSNKVNKNASKLNPTGGTISKDEKLSTFERKNKKIDMLPTGNNLIGPDINHQNYNSNNSTLTTTLNNATFFNGKSVASKLEIFEKSGNVCSSNVVGLSDNVKVKLSDGLKDSVRKISNTIDSYLKDKRDYESMCDVSNNNKVIPPPTPTRNCNTTLTSSTTNLLFNETQNSEQPNQTENQQQSDKQHHDTMKSTTDMIIDMRKSYELMMNSTRSNHQHLYQSRSNSFIQDAQSISGQSLTTRSEYGVGGLTSSSSSFYGGNRQYTNGFNASLANIPRVISASYCGSEMGESDIYSPYSFYGGSEAGADVAVDLHDTIWGVPNVGKSRVKTTNRLRMRKGRSVVHKNIEDNYSAVVVANHEALAQVLEQLQQTPSIPVPLRPLANAINLRFDDFTVLEGGQAFVVGKRAFHSAVWNTSPVTLALSADCNQISGVSGELNQLSGGISDVLNPITEFCDLVPSYHLPLMPSTEVRMMQATISVLPRMQLDTLQSIGAILKNKSQLVDKHMTNFRGSIPNLSITNQQTNEKSILNSSGLRNVYSVQNLTTLNEETQEKPSSDDIINLPGMPSFDDVMCREVGFIMLQLVNGLKNLQAKAIEEMPLSLSNVILCKEIENKDAQARLCVLHG
ncbi:serine-rich adhesin for platelets isoform X2 [Condylostylus longicornis]|nr:serine-rich adhesin for platelets isoform X2 [Condylostylus longicornis]